MIYVISAKCELCRSTDGIFLTPWIVVISMCQCHTSTRVITSTKRTDLEYELQTPHHSNYQVLTLQIDYCNCTTLQSVQLHIAM